MSGVDFFDPALQSEAPRRDRTFGINDGPSDAPSQRQRRAYTTTSDEANWGARVHNDREREVHFTPIDHNVPVDGLCDGMLYTMEDGGELLFVELKDRSRGWITQGVQQLERTIDLYHASDSHLRFARCHAYLCNK